jgi:hypothetical protein
VGRLFGWLLDFFQLENAASIAETETASSGRSRWIHAFVQLSAVVDVAEIAENVARPAQPKNSFHGKYPVPIEFDPLGPDWYGQIEDPSPFQYSRQAGERTLVTQKIERIAVPSQTHVFNCVQARQRIGVVVEIGVTGHKIALTKAHVRDPCIERPYIQNLDLSKGSDMSDEPVDAGADINVRSRVSTEDALGNQQVLNEIMTASRAALLVPIVEAWSRKG